MKVIRVTGVGAGYYAQFHVEAWKRIPGVEYVGLCDLDAAKAHSLAARFDVGRVYGEVGMMLDETGPDVLDIVTLAHTHLALADQAFRRGISVVSQKPLAPNIADARMMIGLAERAHVELLVHENFRFQPWYAEIRQRIHQGRIGEPFAIAFRLRANDGQGPRAYLDRQPYMQSLERFLVHEVLIHLIDVFRFLVGDIRAVYAQIRKLNPIIAGEDAAIVVFEFCGGATGLLDGHRMLAHVATDPRLTMGELVVEGREGWLRLDGEGRVWEKLAAEPEREVAFRWEKRGRGGDAVYRCQTAMVAHLRGEQAYVNTARAYLANLAVEEAIYESAASGSRIEVQVP